MKSLWRWMKRWCRHKERESSGFGYEQRVSCKMCKLILVEDDSLSYFDVQREV